MIDNAASFDKLSKKLFGHQKFNTLSGSKVQGTRFDFENIPEEERLSAVLKYAANIFDQIFSGRDIWLRITFWDKAISSDDIQIPGGAVKFTVNKRHERCVYVHFPGYKLSLVSLILESMIGYELAEPVGKNIGCFFYNFDVPVVVNLYDDRGMDVVTPDSNLKAALEERFSTLIAKSTADVITPDAIIANWVKVNTTGDNWKNQWDLHIDEAFGKTNKRQWIKQGIDLLDRASALLGDSNFVACLSIPLKECNVANEPPIDYSNIPAKDLSHTPPSVYIYLKSFDSLKKTFSPGNLVFERDAYKWYLSRVVEDAELYRWIYVIKSDAVLFMNNETLFEHFAKCEAEDLEFALDSIDDLAFLIGDCLIVNRVRPAQIYNDKALADATLTPEQIKLCVHFLFYLLLNAPDRSWRTSWCISKCYTYDHFPAICQAIEYYCTRQDVTTVHLIYALTWPSDYGHFNEHIVSTLKMVKKVGLPQAKEVAKEVLRNYRRVTPRK